MRTEDSRSGNKRVKASDDEADRAESIIPASGFQLGEGDKSPLNEPTDQDTSGKKEKQTEESFTPTNDESSTQFAAFSSARVRQNGNRRRSTGPPRSISNQNRPQGPVQLPFPENYSTEHPSMAPIRGFGHPRMPYPGIRPGYYSPYFHPHDNGRPMIPTNMLRLCIIAIFLIGLIVWPWALYYHSLRRMSLLSTFDKTKADQFSHLDSNTKMMMPDIATALANSGLMQQNIVDTMEKKKSATLPSHSEQSSPQSKQDRTKNPSSTTSENKSPSSQTEANRNAPLHYRQFGSSSFRNVGKNGEVEPKASKSNAPMSPLLQNKDNIQELEIASMGDVPTSNTNQNAMSSSILPSNRILSTESPFDSNGLKDKNLSPSPLISSVEEQNLKGKNQTMFEKVAAPGYQRLETKKFHVETTSSFSSPVLGEQTNASNGMQSSIIETDMPSKSPNQYGDDRSVGIINSVSPSTDAKVNENNQANSKDSATREYSMHIVVSTYRREELYGWKKAGKYLNLTKSLCANESFCTEPWINDPRIAHIPTSLMWGGINDFLRLKPDMLEDPVKPPRKNCDVIPTPSKAAVVEDKPGTKMFRVSKECPAFLKWIITNYENLPDVVAFVHGNPFHHAKEIVAYLAEAFTRIDQIGFYHFNDVYKDCELFDKKGLCSEWYELMGLGPAKSAPKCYGTFCCAQFAVSRQRLLNVPKAVWQKLYDRVLETAVCYCMEHMWHHLLGEPVKYIRLDGRGPEITKCIDKGHGGQCQCINSTSCDDIDWRPRT